MTKDEAIKYINECDENIGFFVIAVSEDDVEFYLDELEQKKFNDMPKKRQTKFLSQIADEMHGEYEDNFGNKFSQVAKEIFIY